MTKADIRAQIAEKKKRFRDAEPLSARIVQRIQTLETFRTARSVGAYMPLPDEVNIAPLFQCLETNCVREQRFFIPAFDESIGSYRMARWTLELKKGRFGIPEPAEPVFAAEDELDLILVPGVAFDRVGRRVGHGGGFYDRLLPQYRVSRAGICFDFQCLGAVPAEEHDIRMNWVVTETQILKFAMNS
jgi:5-formyltetrahydrofolate cyclo-ligase